jgi:uncharacterized repeat protein (TIGR01451 family)
MQKLLHVTLAVLLLIVSGGWTTPPASEASAYAPAEPVPPGNGEPSVNAAAAPIIADHTVVNQYDDIPQVYIDKVKQMWFDLPGESHSSGYRIGLELLQDLDSRFQVNITEGGTPEAYTNQHLRASRASWGDVSSASGWTYGYGEEDWYTSNTAINRTKAHLAYANTHGLAISALGFGWCWDTTWQNDPGGTIDPVYQVHWAGSSVGGPDGNLRWGLDDEDRQLTGNHVSLATYLSATQQYIDYSLAQGYTTTVFFTTGPVDGSPDESGYQRQLKHDGIRNYVRASSDRVLFDYADILSWSNAGQQNLPTWTDGNGVAKSYQMIHADNMLDLNGSYSEDGDHIGQRGALRLGKAVWWMLARLAGWSGAADPDLTPSSIASSRPMAWQNERITYTVSIRNQTGPLNETVLMTNTLPADLTYVPGSLQATSGTPNDGSASSLRWSGLLSPASIITVTFAVTLTSNTRQSLLNAATIAVPGSAPITRTATLLANPYQVYHPVVKR